MRMHVVYDSHGQIVAAAELSEDISDDTPQARPVTKPDQYSADVDVPADLAHLSFKEVCERSLVDVAQKVLRLKART